MKEEWKNIPDFPLYTCSSTGKIKNIKRNKILKPELDKNGYEKVILSKNGKHKNIAVHRLVALTFLSNLDNLPQVNHKDGNKKNNNLSNLEWCSNYNNIHHAISNGLIKVKGSCNPNAKLKEEDIINIRNWFATGRHIKRELSRIYGVSDTLIKYIIDKKIWRDIDENI